MHHGIDLKEPIHNIKEVRFTRNVGPVERAEPRVFIILENTLAKMVEPIGIEPMT